MNQEVTPHYHPPWMSLQHCCPHRPPRQPHRAVPPRLRVIARHWNRPKGMELPTFILRLGIDDAIAVNKEHYIWPYAVSCKRPETYFPLSNQYISLGSRCATWLCARIEWLAATATDEISTGRDWIAAVLYYMVWHETCASLECIMA
jgi:hypothetical protein